MPLLLILIALFMDPIHLLLSQSHKNSSSWWSKDFVYIYHAENLIMHATITEMEGEGQNTLSTT
jgi:hypothetical protein